MCSFRSSYQGGLATQHHDPVQISSFYPRASEIVLYTHFLEPVKLKATGAVISGHDSPRRYRWTDAGDET